MQDRLISYHLWVRLHMTPEQERAYRTEHAMEEGESTREQLTASLQVEMEGLGISSGWWESVEVS